VFLATPLLFRGRGCGLCRTNNPDRLLNGSAWHPLGHWKPKQSIERAKLLPRSRIPCPAGILRAVIETQQVLL
jgi:hypothetical protein